MTNRIAYLFFCLVLIAGPLRASDSPERECTLTAPANSLNLPADVAKQYRQGSDYVLKTTGFIFPADNMKSIEAGPTGDNSTPYRTGINYHRSLRNDSAETIASYWHPALQQTKLAQLNQPGVMADTKRIFSEIDHVELMAMLDLSGRQVLFIKYNDKIRAYITVKSGDTYYLVSDPALAPQIAIATVALNNGKTVMASH